MDVPSPAAGKITEIVVKVGNKVSMGSLIAKLDAADQPRRSPRTRRTRPTRRKRRTPPKRPKPRPLRPAIYRLGLPRPPRAPPLPISPASSPGPRFAGWRANSVSISTYQGDGREGPDHPEDVKAALAKGAAAPPAARRLPAVPWVDSPNSGPVETVPLSRIKRISGPRLHASWVNMPHVTHTDEATSPISTPSERLSTRTQRRTNQSLTNIVAAAPYAGASCDSERRPEFQRCPRSAGNSLILRRYRNIGVAVDTPDGLVVAVVKDVDKKASSSFPANSALCLKRRAPTSSRRPKCRPRR